MMPTFEFHETALLSDRYFSGLEQKQLCFQFPVKKNSEKKKNNKNLF